MRLPRQIIGKAARWLENSLIILHGLILIKLEYQILLAFCWSLSGIQAPPY